MIRAVLFGVDIASDVGGIHMWMYMRVQAYMLNITERARTVET